MSAKQQKAIASNARLNYLVDKGISPIIIKKEMRHLKLSFIENIAEKRKWQKY
jgi:hypothetical protein